MKHYCPLTGVDLSPDGATNGFKKMCLNCRFFQERKNGEFVCHNENVLETGKKKILESLPEGFEIKTLELEPMKLKDPTKKCANHNFDMVRVVSYLSNYFGLEPPTAMNTENENAPE